MRRENREPTPRELQSITTPGLVRRIIQPTRKPRTDEEVLESIHQEELACRHDDEDDYLRGERILRECDAG